MEVSLIACGYSWPHSFPVGRIVRRENRRSAQSNTAPSHLPTLALPVDLIPDSPSPTDPDAPARRRLIKHNFPPHEVISPIEAMTTSEDEVKVIGHHSGDIAQKSIDVIDKVVHISSHMPQFLTLTACDSSLTTHSPSPPCNNSVASTSLLPSFTIKSVTYFMEKSISNVCRTFMVMIWCGS